MGRAHPPQRSRPPPDDQHDSEQPDIRALIEENARLKQLVIQLSRLILKNVVGRN